MKKIKIIFMILMIFSFVFVDKFAYAYETIVNSQKVQTEEEIRQEIDRFIKNYTGDNYRETYVEVTISGTTYTAPANGWLVLNKLAQAEGQEIRLTNSSNSLRGYAVSPDGNNRALDTMVPCLKGDVIGIYYSASGNTEDFKFIYAEGEN